MKTNKQSGFSLVELMVVVAIIGILATVAIPNFNRFQAKAKQSSAKSELTGIYTTEKAFFAEYSTYHTNLAYVGYLPDGFPIVDRCPTVPAGQSRAVRYYTTGFSANGSGSAAAQDNPNGAPPLSPNCKAFQNPGAKAPGDYLVNFFPSTVSDGTNSQVVFSNLNYTSDGSTFLAGAQGNISGSGGLDSWSINENKLLANTLFAASSSTESGSSESGLDPIANPTATATPTSAPSSAAPTITPSAIPPSTIE